MEKDIGKIKKNDQSDIIIRVDDFGGKSGVTIREFVTSERYTGFTKSGVRISAEEFPKFREMINSISEKDLQSDGNQNESNVSDSKQKTLSKEKIKIEKPGKAKEELPDY